MENNIKENPAPGGNTGGDCKKWLVETVINLLHRGEPVQVAYAEDGSVAVGNLTMGLGALDHVKVIEVPPETPPEREAVVKVLQEVLNTLGDPPGEEKAGYQIPGVNLLFPSPADAAWYGIHRVGKGRIIRAKAVVGEYKEIPLGGKYTYAVTVHAWEVIRWVE